jgi:hypothetical protein
MNYLSTKKARLGNPPAFSLRISLRSAVLRRQWQTIRYVRPARKGGVA